MFKLEMHKNYSCGKTLYKVKDNFDDSYIGITFRNKFYNAIIVVDHKAKEIVLHDIPNIYVEEIVNLIRQREKWNKYYICNGFVE